MVDVGVNGAHAFLKTKAANKFISEYNDGEYCIIYNYIIYYVQSEINVLWRIWSNLYLSHCFLNTIRVCILKEGSPGMILVLSTLFVHARVMPPMNDIEQICRCPGEKLNVPNLCHKIPRLLNYACYIVISWPSQQPRSGFLKFELEIRFLLLFWQRCSILHRNLKHVASERTLSYAMLQCVGILLTLDIIQVTWPFDV